MQARIPHSTCRRRFRLGAWRIIGSSSVPFSGILDRDNEEDCYKIYAMIPKWNETRCRALLTFRHVSLMLEFASLPYITWSTNASHIRRSHHVSGIKNSNVPWCWEENHVKLMLKNLTCICRRSDKFRCFSPDRILARIGKIGRRTRGSIDICISYIK